MKQTIRQRLILKVANDSYKKTLAYKLIMAKRFLNTLEILNIPLTTSTLLGGWAFSLENAPQTKVPGSNGALFAVIF